MIIWTSPSGHRWFVRSPELDPPWWEGDGEPDTRCHDHGPDGDPPPTDAAGFNAAGFNADGWPRDIDSWRRREAHPPPGDPWKRRAV